MLAQSREVGEGTRKFRVDPRMQNRLEPVLLQFPGSRPFVEEQTQFGNEADVRDGDVVAYQELAVGR